MTTYYRATHTPSPSNDVPWMLFVCELDGICNGNYGSYYHQVNNESGNIVDIEDLIPQIRDILIERGYDELEAKMIADESNPDDIVNSAGFWDNVDLVNMLYDELLSDSDIDGIETYDGMIILNESIVTPYKL